MLAAANLPMPYMQASQIHPAGFGLPQQMGGFLQGHSFAVGLQPGNYFQGAMAPHQSMAAVVASASAASGLASADPTPGES